MECLSYVDLSHDYSKSIILTICHHITNTYICAIPPLNVCYLCQMCIKPNLRPAGRPHFLVPPPSAPLRVHQWRSDHSPFSSLSPSPYLLMMLSLITYSPSSSLFSYSTSLLSALFCRQYLSETKNLKVQIIWNWIRSCSSINSPMICYEEFWWCLVWARPATLPRPTL